MTYSSRATAYLTDLELTFSQPDLEFLQALQSRHVAKYSFNSLAVILGDEVKVDSASVFEKIVQQGLGGYCFEHNKLTYDLLFELGFKVRILMAKVANSNDIDAPRTHRISLVDLAGEQYIVDTGFGHLGCRLPIRLALGKVQNQGQASYRLQRNDGGEYCLEILKQGAFTMLFRFDFGSYTEADCLVSNFYTSKHPQSNFVNNLILSRKLENGIRSLRNAQYHQISEGITDVTEVTSLAQLSQLLKEVFSLELETPIIEPLYERFVKS
ncbi:MAG: arylamine N-acetyltransferase [Pseudomonadales bacterium]|nr:arylamine N-acetyltransferase [Pseudomonadales bacterium]